MNSSPFDLGHLDAIEVDLEYMIVDNRSLQPRNIASAVLRRLNQHENERNPAPYVQISNTLVQHTLRLTNTAAQGNFYKLESAFVDSIRSANRELEKNGAQLLSSSVHPYMDPLQEGALYDIETSDPLRILLSQVNYRQHVWLNSQTSAFRISYSNESEFVQLHNALILLLPLIPALSASSPYLEGNWQECLDTRTLAQSRKFAAVPAITGDYIPQVTSSYEDYIRSTIDPIRCYILSNCPRITGSDVENINGRAVVPLFREKKIEVRILGTQEAPGMDLSIISFLMAALRTLLQKDPADLAEALHRSTSLQRKTQLQRTCEKGFDSSVEATETSALFGLGNLPITAGKFWQAIFDQIIANQSFEYGFDSIQLLLSKGSLAQRIFYECGQDPDNFTMKGMLFTLAARLPQNKPFLPR